MSENSTYKIIELVGTSSESWEQAATNAVNKASKSVRNLRIAEAKSFDVKLNNGKVEAFRVRMSISFKYEGD